jgi:hypothetical protein
MTFFSNFMFVFRRNDVFSFASGMFFVWFHIFTMLPAAAHLFGSIKSIHSTFLSLPATVSAVSKTITRIFTPSSLLK